MRSTAINNSQRRNRDESAWTLFKTYCEATSLHGFKYLTENNRPWYERSYWLIAIIVVQVLVSLVIYEQIVAFRRSPVLTSFESSQTPVSDIPFPAITLCPDSQIYTSAFNFTDALKSKTQLEGEEKEKYNYALTTCHIFDAGLGNDDVLSNVTYSHKIRQQMSHSVNGEARSKKMVPVVSWERLIVFSPTRYFQPLTTIFGACISFNLMPLDQILRYPPTSEENWAHKYFGGRKSIWSPDDGFSTTNNMGNLLNVTPPWHSGNSSLGTQVYFLLKLPKNGVDNSCNSGGRGFNGYLHNPVEIPGNTHPVFYADGDRTTVIQVTPKIFTIKPDLKSWRPSERSCFYQEERWLKYFNIYTQRNCELECETNFTVTFCGCTAHFHPGISYTPLCGTRHIVKCAEKYFGLGSQDDCNCLPSCSEIQYDIGVVPVYRKWVDHLLSYQDDNESVHTMIEIRYNVRYIQGINRAVLFSWPDFIANIGGLLGLFLGFSILSVVEVIYFLSLRNYTRIKRKKRENKSI